MPNCQVAFKYSLDESEDGFMIVVNTQFIVWLQPHKQYEYRQGKNKFRFNIKRCFVRWLKKKKTKRKRT